MKTEWKTPRVHTEHTIEKTLSRKWNAKDKAKLDLEEQIRFYKRLVDPTKIEIFLEYERIVELYVGIQNHLHEYATFLRLWEARYPDQYKDIVIEYQRVKPTVQ